MKKQNTAVRRAALAVLYLAVFAAAVMYLRVTISVPAEGDDKLTLNGWLYDMGRMSFWQYALQDLKERLSFFLLKQVRFFPFHYPNAVALLFYRTLASYRLYIIAMTGVAAFLVSRVAAKLSRSNALALGAFGLALAAAPIFNEGMYSYYAVPQRTLLWAAASWLCLFYLHESHHRAWGVAAAVLAFIACGTYETGYVYAVLALLLWVVYTRSVRGGLRASAPVLGGMAVAFCFHFASSRHGGTGNELSLDIPNVARVTVQQMTASIPFLGPWAAGAGLRHHQQGRHALALCAGAAGCSGAAVCRSQGKGQRQVPRRPGPAGPGAVGCPGGAAGLVRPLPAARGHHLEVGLHPRGSQFGGPGPAAGGRRGGAGRTVLPSAESSLGRAARFAGSGAGGGYCRQRRVHPRLPAHPPR